MRKNIQECVTALGGAGALLKKSKGTRARLITEYLVKRGYTCETAYLETWETQPFAVREAGEYFILTLTVPLINPHTNKRSALCLKIK